MVQRIAQRRVNPEPRPSLVHDRLSYALALPLLVSEHDELARAYIESACAIDAKKAWYPGLGEALRAVSQRDPIAFVSAAKTVLKKQNAYARARRSWYYNSPGAFLCVPATVLAMMASRRGMKLPDNLSGRYATIKLGVRHLEEFDGRPIGRNSTSDLVVDFIPESRVIAS